tara:strand:- start:113 stop:802 length:690 start_codon:yes stop_codon:yes gene_type:complete
MSVQNERWIIVFDWETDGKDPKNCNPVELAAVPIDPKTLEIRKDKGFQATIRPDGIDKEEYFTDDRKKTIEWHAQQRGVSSDDIIELWKSGQSEKIVWKNFCKYCQRYNIDKVPGQWYTEPIPAGYNIIGYDLKICERIATKYKTKMPLSTVTKLDIMDLMWYWFENLEEPRNYRLDTFREFFGIKAEQAHEALSDAIDEAKLLVQFLKFHRRQASVGKFKGAFANEDV